MPTQTTTYSDGQVLSGARLNTDFITRETNDFGFKEHFFGSVNLNTNYNVDGTGAIQSGTRMIFRAANGNNGITMPGSRWQTYLDDHPLTLEARFKTTPAAAVFFLGLQNKSTADTAASGAFVHRNSTGSFVYVTRAYLGSTITYDNADDPGNDVFAVFRMDYTEGSVVFYKDGVQQASHTANLLSGQEFLTPTFQCTLNASQAGSLYLDWFAVRSSVL